MKNDPRAEHYPKNAPVISRFVYIIHPKGEF